MALFENCLKSVLAQSFDKIEYIVIDGLSTDGTLNLIKSYDSELDFWLSESDAGIYDAMNKGIQAARGDWIYFIGADDELAGSRVLELVSKHLDSKLDLVCGAVRYPDGRIVKSWIGPKTLLHNTVHHQGAFYNASLFREWRYDASLKVSSDYELNLVLYKRGSKYKKLDETIAVCGDMGLSLTNMRTAFIEINDIRKRHVSATSNFFFNFIFFLSSLAYRLIRAIKSWRKPA